MATLTLSQLSRQYGPYVAVDALNLVVRDGECVTLLGPDGCGKSTALQLIAGLTVPTGGSVAVDGRVLSSPQGCVPLESRGMGMLFHSIALWPHLTVAENVAYGLRQMNVADDDVARRVAVSLMDAQYEKNPHSYPRHLAPLDQVRAAFARTLAVDPTILLLDDAFGKLPPEARREAAAHVRAVAQARGITMLAVTGDVQEAMVMSDRIAAMNRGRIEQTDTPGGLYMQPETAFVAKLMGPAMLFEGQRSGRLLVFPPFAMESKRVRHGMGPDGAVTISIRPEHFGLVADKAEVSPAHIPIAGHIRARTFHGTHWDYAFEAAQDAGATTFSVACPNTRVFGMGASVWLAIDPAQINVLR
jgi:ABC-type Fe3+/spermidine/putrescine transport system ATPase subunit